MLAESEYAAWVICNRYYLNHFTITIQKLKENHNTIETFNAFLESIGITNEAGGKIKVSQDKKLRQSSTVAKPFQRYLLIKMATNTTMILQEVMLSLLNVLITEMDLKLVMQIKF